MTSNCFQSLLAVYRVDRITKRNMEKIDFFKGMVFILICFSLSFITSEQMELESWAWAQKTRLSMLYPDMLASTFDFSVSSLHKRTKVKCVFFIGRIRTILAAKCSFVCVCMKRDNISSHLISFWIKKIRALGALTMCVWLRERVAACACACACVCVCVWVAPLIITTPSSRLCKMRTCAGAHFRGFEK